MSPPLKYPDPLVTGTPVTREPDDIPTGPPEPTTTRRVHRWVNEATHQEQLTNAELQRLGARTLHTFNLMDPKATKALNRLIAIHSRPGKGSRVASIADPVVVVGAWMVLVTTQVVQYLEQEEEVKPTQHANSSSKRRPKRQ